MHPRIPSLWLAFLGVALLGPALATARAEPEPARVDLTRMTGRWYLLARLPADAGHRSFGAQVQYTLSGSTIQEAYSAHAQSLGGPVEKKEVTAAVANDQPGRWRTKDGWLASRDRLVLYVSPGYQCAIVADPARDNAWLLAREPEVPEWTYAGLLARLQVQGYDVSKLKRIVQKPEQAGRPGFE